MILLRCSALSVLHPIQYLRLLFIVETKVLTTRPTVRIKVRFLTQADSSLSYYQVLSLVIESRSVVHASVVPD
jgi:hypothetical protein